MSKKQKKTEIAGPIIAQLEHLYTLFQAEHPELPSNVVFILGHGRMPQGGVKWGHAATGRWQHQPSPRSKAQDAYEIMISSECLAEGAMQVFQTTRHEAVHLYNIELGIRDTSRQNRYHNQRFLKSAEVLGMQWGGEYRLDKDGNETDQPLPHPAIGLSQVVPTPELVRQYKDEIKALDKVITAAGISYTPPVRPVRQVAVVIFDEDEAEIELGLKTYEKLEDYLLPHTMEVEER